MFFKNKMLLLVKQSHLPSETLVHIDGEAGGWEEKREKVNSHLLGENSGSATFCLILFAKQDKGKSKITDSKRLVTRDKHSDSTQRSAGSTK